MQQSIPANPSEPLTPTTHRLRTVTGNRWPRKCACGCDQPIPRAADIRYVVDFGVPRPYPTYLREHSPDYGTYRGRPSPRADVASLPGFVTAKELLEISTTAEPSAPTDSGSPIDNAHPEADASPSPQAGRPWASGQLVFNAGQFESARSGFADYAKDGETGEQLRTRVNRIILQDLEQKVLALRALHEKLRDQLAGPSFGDLVARSRPV